MRQRKKESQYRCISEQVTTVRFRTSVPLGHASKLFHPKCDSYSSTLSINWLYTTHGGIKLFALCLDPCPQTENIFIAKECLQTESQVFAVRSCQNCESQGDLGGTTKHLLHTLNQLFLN